MPVVVALLRLCRTRIHKNFRTLTGTRRRIPANAARRHRGPMTAAVARPGGMS